MPDTISLRLRILEEWRREIDLLRPDVQAEILKRVEEKVDRLFQLAVGLGIAFVGALTTLMTLLIVQLLQ